MFTRIKKALTDLVNYVLSFFKKEDTKKPEAEETKATKTTLNVISVKKPLNRKARWYVGHSEECITAILECIICYTNIYRKESDFDKREAELNMERFGELDADCVARKIVEGVMTKKVEGVTVPPYDQLSYTVIGDDRFDYYSVVGDLRDQFGITSHAELYQLELNQALINTVIEEGYMVEKDSFTDAIKGLYETKSGTKEYDMDMAVTAFKSVFMGGIRGHIIRKLKAWRNEAYVSNAELIDLARMQCDYSEDSPLRKFTHEADNIPFGPKPKYTYEEIMRVDPANTEWHEHLVASVAEDCKRREEMRLSGGVQQMDSWSNNEWIPQGPAKVDNVYFIHATPADTGIGDNNQ